MSTKEFISHQIENFSSSLIPQQFTELAETENSLIILEIPCKDYVLTEIARIIESNNAQVMSLTVAPVSGGSLFLVSIKLNVVDISAVLRSFERFDYKVVYYFMKEGEITDTHKKRLDELLYYLEM